ncbi:MAG: N-6 DNA methylase [Nitrospirota bacterium]
MDKQQAKHNIQEIFEKSFDKNRFTLFIKNLLKRIDEAPFTYQGQYIPESYRQYIRTLERIGKFNDGENRIDILIIKLQKEASLERARTMQRNFVAWYLNGSRGGELKDAAMVAFVSPDEKDWRFSLVKMDYKFEQTKTGRIKVKEDFTPARRWSFLVGKNENSHTAQSRLVGILANDEHSPTLAELEQAFDIETVTKEFFIKYRELFIRTKEELDKVVKNDSKIRADFEAKGVNTVDFAKKLLGQIIFLYFLQKKGWFGVGRDAAWGTGSKHFLRELFKKKHGDYKNFFNDILEPLFYEALRIDRSHDDDYYSRFNCKIPFLNGGLFDPIGSYDWVHTDIHLPDSLFSNTVGTKEGDIGDGILDIFDRYNFTVREDEPLEKEVAIDPELLGKAYEKFNAIRPDNFEEYKKALKSGNKGEESKFNKQYGVYYTPREIVHYMCQQSLINYLFTECNTPSPLMGEGRGEGVILSEVKNPILSQEDIETLVHFGEQVRENEARVETKGKETRTYSYKLPESIRKNASLLDQKLSDITVCDPAVGSGAFPVGMMSEIVKIRMVLNSYLCHSRPSSCHSREGGNPECVSRTPYDFKRHCIEKSLYGVDIDSGAVEIAKLRLWLSLVVDEDDIKNIKPLPNLDYKIVCGNSLLGVEKNLLNNALFNELERLKPLLFNETNPTKKQDYKKQIDELISQITNGHTEFDFEVYFSEVFHASPNSPFGKGGQGGFDVVIANPPYVKEYTNRKSFDGLRNSPYYQGKMDIWYLFACKGIDSLKNSAGILTFIAQNNWVTSYGASKMRNKVIQDTRIINLVDFCDYKIFESADIQTMIMIFQRDSKGDNYSFDYRRLTEKDANFEDMLNLLNKGTASKNDFLKPTIQRKNFLDKTFTFSHSDNENILNKISQQSNFKLTENEVAQGIVFPQDFVNKESQKILGDKFNVGEGIFVLSDKENNSIPFTKEELELIKPSYTTKELGRYGADKHNSEWVIYTDSGFKYPKNIKPYPNIKKHLDKFQKVITSDNRPYGLHRARDEKFFKGEKIIAVRKCIEPTFTYTDFDCYVSATFYVIKSERINLKYLTAILNSKLIAFWLKYKGKMQGNNYQIDKEPLLAIPIYNPSSKAQQPFITLVDQILAAKKKDPNADTTALERQIDKMVYALYGLTPDEIAIVEGRK